MTLFHKNFFEKILEFFEINLYFLLLLNIFIIDSFIDLTSFGLQITPVFPFITDSLVPPKPLEIDGVP